jgi:hypothetical protein
MKGPKERIQQAIDENIRGPIQVAITLALTALVVAFLALIKTGK